MSVSYSLYLGPFAQCKLAQNTTVSAFKLMDSLHERLCLAGVNSGPERLLAGYHVWVPNVAFGLERNPHIDYQEAMVCDLASVDIDCERTLFFEAFGQDLDVLKEHYNGLKNVRVTWGYVSWSD